MLLSKLLQVAVLLTPVICDQKYHKLDFSIKKGAKLVDAVHDFVEGVGDSLGLDKKDGTHSIDLKNERAFYITQIKIGDPAKEVKVLVDTGSADLWVMSTKNPYCASNGGSINCQQYGTYNEDESKTFQRNDTAFSINYLDETFANGTFGQDTVELTEDFVIDNANFAVADNSDSNVGVFGIAYRELESSRSLYDNLPVQMKKQGLINKIAYSLYLTPAERDTGSVLFGGIDHAKYTGDLAKFDIPPMNGDIAYLQIPLSSISFNINSNVGSTSSAPPSPPTTLATSQSPHPTIAAVTAQRHEDKAKRADGNSSGLPTIDTQGINALLDSGTTLSYFSQEIVDQFVDNVDPNASFNAAMGGYQVDCSLRQPGNNVTFSFDHKKDITVPLSDMVLIAGQNSSTGKNICMLGVAQSSHTILGDNFLRHCYSVFDLEDDTISIAQMNWNDEEEDIETLE